MLNLTNQIQFRNQIDFKRKVNRILKKKMLWEFLIFNLFRNKLFFWIRTMEDQIFYCPLKESYITNPKAPPTPRNVFAKAPLKNPLNPIQKKN